jgi:hypothetical protein
MLTAEQAPRLPFQVWAITGDGMSLVGDCVLRSGNRVLVEAVVEGELVALPADVHRTPGASFLRFPSEARASEDYRRLLRAVGLAEPDR